MTIKATTKNGTTCYNHFDNITLEDVKNAWLNKLVNFKGIWLEVVKVELI